MAEEDSQTDAKMNGVGARLAYMRLTDGGSGSNQLSSTDGGSKHVIEDKNGASSSQKRTFKSVVQRHFVKDKLFFLVNDLLKSVDEERQAQEDLIASFQTVREVTGPIRRQSIAAASHRTKRRRKRVDTPLLERIEQNRKESREPLENIEIYNKDAAAVGKMEILANEANDADCEHERETESKYKEVSVKDSVKSETITETMEINNDMDRLKYKHNTNVVENDETRRRQKSKSLPASETEKLSAIYELHRDENTSEVDKLVLDSVLHENDIVETKDTENSKPEVSKGNGHGNASENDEETNSELTVAVESNSESDEDETYVKVVGSNDEIEEDVFNEEIHDLGNEDEIKKIKDSNSSTMEYNKTTASLPPTLDPIAEASSESFQSLPLSSRDSSSIIEIEPKEGAFPWPVDSNVYANDSKVKTNGGEDNGSSQTPKDSSGDQSNKPNIRNNIWVIDCKEKKKSYGHCKTKKQSTPKDELDLENVQYKYADNLEDSEFKCHEKFNKRKKPDNPSKHYLKSSSGKKREQGRYHSYSSPDDTKYGNSVPHRKNKSKSNRRISLDLLGVYEENTDLQRVSRSELDPSKQSAGKQKSTSSPKRSRSKSPAKKRARDRKTRDLKPLPPMTSTSNCQSRKNPCLTLYRSKTELSSRSSSTSSNEDMKESYKNLRSLKDDRRYRKPDFVLWERLDISEGRPKDRREGIEWSDDFGYEVKHTYSGLTENGCRSDMDSDGRNVTWNVPINEAIKNITGSKNVPDISKITHTLPREERVGRLYIDLKQERRASGFLEYRRLDTAERKEEADEFTHL